MIVGTITLIYLLFGGGVFSFDVFKEAAADVISDKQIVKQIDAMTSEADKEMKAWLKESGKISKQFSRMNQNYDQTKMEMNAFLEQADSSRDEFLEKIIQLRFQVKNLMSQEEWEAMYAKIE